MVVRLECRLTSEMSVQNKLCTKSYCSGEINCSKRVNCRTEIDANIHGECTKYK